MSDPDQPGEDVDDDVLGDEDYPPDRPLGAESDGVTAVEEEGGESFYHRDRATEPEVWERDDDRDADDRDELGGIGELIGDQDVGLPDDEPDLVASATGAGPGPRDPDDVFSGDPTIRDVATEHAPRPAEEAAVHLDEEEDEDGEEE